MANNLTITKSYSENGLASSITESALDDFVGSIETFYNTTRLTSDNLADEGIESGNIQTSAITADKIADSAIDTAELADEVIGTTNIADDAITGTELNVPTIPNDDGFDPGVGNICRVTENTASGTVSIPQTPSWATVFTFTLTTTGRAVFFESFGGVTFDQNLGINSNHRIVRDTLTTVWSTTVAGAAGTLPKVLENFIDDVGEAGTYVYEYQVSLAGVGQDRVGTLTDDVLIMEL